MEGIISALGIMAAFFLVHEVIMSLFFPDGEEPNTVPQTILRAVASIAYFCSFFIGFMITWRDVRMEKISLRKSQPSESYTDYLLDRCHEAEAESERLRSELLEARHSLSSRYFDGLSEGREDGFLEGFERGAMDILRTPELSDDERIAIQKRAADTLIAIRRQAYMELYEDPE